MPGTPATTARLGLPRYDNNVDPADFATQINALSDRLDELVQMRDESLPIGGQAPYGGVGDPAGGKWLLCDGRELLTVDYPELQAVIGFRYSPGGQDPGNGRFNIPDKRGRASVGADTMATARGSAGRFTTAKGHPNVLGQNGGEERHLLLATESGVKAHSVAVTINDPQHRHSHTFSAVDLDIMVGAGNVARVGTRNAENTDYTSTGITASGSVSSQDAANEHNIVQPYEVDNWIIRVR